jgi:hypothetical protein
MAMPQERSRILEHGTDEITRAFQEAVRRALMDHYRTGDPIAVWRDGSVVWVPAEEIPALLGIDEPESETGTAPNPSPVRAI